MEEDDSGASRVHNTTGVAVTFGLSHSTCVVTCFCEGGRVGGWLCAAPLVSKIDACHVGSLGRGLHCLAQRSDGSLVQHVVTGHSKVKE